MGKRNRQLISGDEAVSVARQHVTPCSDCPFARSAFPGWLGSMDAGEWVRCVHGETFIECHVTTNAQCAGAAIYRGNVGKVPRDPDQLRLSKNTQLVFASPLEFLAHHQTKKVSSNYGK